jgi:hypothetical protein
MRKKTNHHKSRSFIEIRLYHDATPYTYKSKISNVFGRSTNEIDLFVPESEKNPEEVLQKWFRALSDAVKNVKRYPDIDKYHWGMNFIENKSKKKKIMKEQQKEVSTVEEVKSTVVVPDKSKEPADKLHIDETKQNIILIISTLLACFVIIQSTHLDTLQEQVAIYTCALAFLVLLYLVRRVEIKTEKIIWKDFDENKT